ncbi:MAG: hypothetical protein NTX57_22960 [Armatimonadetes bacterium]|nr:hypothetical protein [Armatimonadota bacterium]
MKPLDARGEQESAKAHDGDCRRRPPPDVISQDRFTIGDWASRGRNFNPDA